MKYALSLYQSLNLLSSSVIFIDLSLYTILKLNIFFYNVWFSDISIDKSFMCSPNNNDYFDIIFSCYIVSFD